MTRIFATFAACAMMTTTASAQIVQESKVLNLTPEWLETNATPKVLDQMVDPDSAKIEWKYSSKINTRVDKVKNPEGKKVPVTTRFAVTCGTFNGKNRMGGYAGKHFLIAINWPSGVQINMDEVDGMCEQMIANGEIHPL